MTDAATAESSSVILDSSRGVVVFTVDSCGSLFELLAKVISAAPVVCSSMRSGIIPIMGG